MRDDKRREERVLIEAPVKLSQGTGQTRNMSSSGIYFVTDQHSAPGSRIDFSVQLDYVCPGKSIILDCQGLVVRVEVLGEQLGIAAQIEECWCSQAID